MLHGRASCFHSPCDARMLKKCIDPIEYRGCGWICADVSCMRFVLGGVGPLPLPGSESSFVVTPFLCFEGYNSLCG